MLLLFFGKGMVASQTVPFVLYHFACIRVLDINTNSLYLYNVIVKLSRYRVYKCGGC